MSIYKRMSLSGGKMPEEKQLNEKDEKEVMKHDEKTEENDLLSSLAWAFILIWAGLVFLASNLGWFERLGLIVDSRWVYQSLEDWRSFGVWNLVAMGAGVIFLLETIARLLLPAYRRHIMGSFIVALVFISLGFGGWVNWSYIWPFILIAAGISVLASGLGRKRQ
jgi:hypothetical protein